MSRALIVTYHAVEPGPPPLCVEPALLARHLDCVLESGAGVLTVGALGEALRAGSLPERAVAVAFDDGYASVVREALPLLEERGLVATVFCVAARLGERSDWPSRARWAPVLPLASGPELARLAAAGWEIGSHGLDHEPRATADELAESRILLEEVAGAPVRSFAYPYGIVPTRAEAALAEAGYRAACTVRAAPVRTRSNPFLLPRVDAHYLRTPVLLRAALAGRLDLYLAARGVATRARRRARPDHAR